MEAKDVQVGSTITNGISAVRIDERVNNGWGGIYISLTSGSMTGEETIVLDEFLGSWRHVPFEWTPVVGGGLEERYVWSADWTRLQREVRPLPFQVGERVRFNDDEGMGEGVGIVRRSEPGKVWVETLFNMWRGADPAWFVRTADPLPAGLERDKARLALAVLGLVDCRAEHGAGHPDCPKCWRWSERNPNREPRP